MPKGTAAAVGQGGCGGQVHVRLIVGRWMSAAASGSSIRAAHIHSFWVERHSVNIAESVVEVLRGIFAKTTEAIPLQYCFEYCVLSCQTDLMFFAGISLTAQRIMFETDEGLSFFFPEVLHMELLNN